MSLKEKFERDFETYPQEFGLDLHKEEDQFKWFLASVLFAKRISAKIAKKTYREFEKEDLTTPDSIIEAGWDKLVEVLDKGGYTRYDESTATNLIELSKKLKEEYGSIGNLYQQATSKTDLEKKLKDFKGVGPTTVNIFLRDMRPIWDYARPKISPPGEKMAQKLGIEDKEDIKELEPYLVKIYLELCKNKKCEECLAREYCPGK
ncbi:MAG: hypothetical protein R6U44_04695 [Archaeoglobaceae archaeon]